MSNLVQSYAKRGVSTSRAWHWPKRLFFGLAMVLLLLPASKNVAATPICGVELNLTLVDFNHCGGRVGSIDALKDTVQLRTRANTPGAVYSHTTFIHVSHICIELNGWRLMLVNSNITERGNLPETTALIQGGPNQ